MFEGLNEDYNRKKKSEYRKMNRKKKQKNLEKNGGQSKIDNKILITEMNGAE